MMLNEKKKKSKNNPGKIFILFILFIVLGIFVLDYFRDSGEGMLVVNTYPVTGTFSVGKNLRGESNSIFYLKKGLYQVSFSDYSEQYITPKDQTIRISPGKTFPVTGEYKNRFLPETPPDGFKADSLRVYGTQERKCKDGTIFSYINGGALVYLKYGLYETTHAVYYNNNGTELVADIFDMKNMHNSRAALADPEICPPGSKDFVLGDSGKMYNYPPDFFIYFCKSRYLVFISINDDNQKEMLLSFASEIASNIP